MMCAVWFKKKIQDFLADMDPFSKCKFAAFDIYAGSASSPPRQYQDDIIGRNISAASRNISPPSSLGVLSSPLDVNVINMHNAEPGSRLTVRSKDAQLYV